MSATATPAMDESTLIRRIRDGEGRLFRQLVDRHLGAVYNLIYRMTGNADTSEELTQETFVRAYQYLDRFDASRPLKPWLLRIASNVTVTHLRKTSRVVSLTELEESGQWEEAQFGQTDADSQPLSRMEHRLNGELVARKLQDLDIKYRQVLLLRYTEDLSYEQIAEATGLPLNTVRTRLKRGLEKLKDLIAKEKD